MKKHLVFVSVIILYLVTLNSASAQLESKKGKEDLQIEIWKPLLDTHNRVCVLGNVFKTLIGLKQERNIPKGWRGIPYKIDCVDNTRISKFSLEGKTFLRTTLNEDIIYDNYLFNEDMTYVHKTLYSNNSTISKTGRYFKSDDDITFTEISPKNKKIKITFIFEIVNSQEFNLYRGKEADNYILEKVF